LKPTVLNYAECFFRDLFSRAGERPKTIRLIAPAVTARSTGQASQKMETRMAGTANDSAAGASLSIFSSNLFLWKICQEGSPKTEVMTIDLSPLTRQFTQRNLA
jgi:hypothetical protein